MYVHVTYTRVLDRFELLTMFMYIYECFITISATMSLRDVDPVVERLLQWLPYLLEHLDAFINRFHTQTVSLGEFNGRFFAGHTNALA